MKQFFKKILSISLIFCLLISSQAVFATKEDAKTESEQAEEEVELPLYEKLGYQDDFEYNDVMIGHILKSTVVYILQETYYTVSYLPYEVHEENLIAFIEACEEVEETAAEEADAADEEPEEITPEQMAAYILENHQDFFRYGEEETIEQYVGGQGSGVVLGDNGYIATNAHVVLAPTEEDLEFYSYYDLSEFWDYELITMSNTFARYGIPLEAYDLSDFFYENYDYYNFYDRPFTVDLTETTVTVYTPTSDGLTDLEIAESYEAEVLECGVSVDNIDSSEGLTKDIAILKIDEENMVGLSLSTTYPEVLSDIYSGGFPAAAKEVFEEDVYKSTLSVSNSPGKVSRHITIKGTDYKAMEITSTISWGSSGGPSVDAHAQIEGLNTYGNSYDQRFAYMVPAEAVIDMADGYDIEQDEISKTFLAGIQMLQQGYGKAAKDCFHEVQLARRSVPYLDEMVTLAEAAPQETPLKEEEEAEPEEVVEETPATNWQLINILVIAGIVVLVAAIVVVIIIIVKKKKKKATAVLAAPDWVETYEDPTVIPVYTDTANTANTVNTQYYPQETPVTPNATANNYQETTSDPFFSRGSDLDL